MDGAGGWNSIGDDDETAEPETFMGRLAGVWGDSRMRWHTEDPTLSVAGAAGCDQRSARRLPIGQLCAECLIAAELRDGKT